MQSVCRNCAVDDSNPKRLCNTIQASLCYANSLLDCGFVVSILICFAMTPHTLALTSRVANMELRRHGVIKRHGDPGEGAYHQWPLTII